jgi:excisionase family DNA binding protein
LELASGRQKRRDANPFAEVTNIETMLRDRPTILDPNQHSMTKIDYPSGAPKCNPGKQAVPQDRYQTVHEVAERLEVAEATVRQWIKSGSLRAIDIGKGWRISDTDLTLFLAARETAPRRRGDGSTADPNA